METNNNQEQGTEVKKDFVAPTKASDFPEGETKITYTYENQNTVVWLLLKNGSVARIREGSGEDVEKAEIECEEDRNKYMSSMMAATITIDGKVLNMYELTKQLKMKDYLTVKSEFVTLNF